MTKLRDLTGQRFGRLTVISYSGGSKWRCRCDCGSETTVLSGNLTSGHTTSCGCAKGAGIIGRKFGRLLVVERLDKDMYLCKCECGNTCTRTYKSLHMTVPHACDPCGKALRAQALRASAFADGTQPAKVKLDKVPSKANKSGIVGVNWDKSRGKWQASIKFRGHKYNLGRFENIQDAIDARHAAEREIFGAYIDSKKPPD